MPAERTRTITLITLLRRTSQLMVDELIERLRAAGFPESVAAQHPVFENIDPDGTRLTVLAARAGMTHQSMSELVQSMVTLGHLERRPDPSDRRARLIALTPYGRRMVRTAVGEIAAIEAAWLERWRAAGFDVDVRSMLDAGLEAHRSQNTDARST